MDIKKVIKLYERSIEEKWLPLLEKKDSNLHYNITKRCPFCDIRQDFYLKHTCKICPINPKICGDCGKTGELGIARESKSKEEMMASIHKIISMMYKEIHELKQLKGVKKLAINYFSALSELSGFAKKEITMEELEEELEEEETRNGKSLSR